MPRKFKYVHFHEKVDKTCMGEDETFSMIFKHCEGGCWLGQSEQKMKSVDKVQEQLGYKMEKLGSVSDRQQIILLTKIFMELW